MKICQVSDKHDTLAQMQMEAGICMHEIQYVQWLILRLCIVYTALNMASFPCNSSYFHIFGKQILSTILYWQGMTGIAHHSRIARRNEVDRYF